MTGESHKLKQRGRFSKIATTVWVTVEYVAVSIADALSDYIDVARKEIELFLGWGFVIMGLLNWSSSKYCDGNTADYLSCTRPTTYYYYGAFEILLVLAGAFLLLVWYVRNKRS